MHLQFILTRTVAVVCGTLAVLLALKAIGDSIPDYHAFWSGVFFWSVGAGVLVLPAGLTWILTRRHTRYAVPLAGCAAVWAVATLVAVDSRAVAVAVFTAGVLAIFTLADRLPGRPG